MLLAPSTDSPLWYGVDTGFASYRYPAWTRWPTAGAREIFGTVCESDRQVRTLLESGVPPDDGMICFDARLFTRDPTVEVVADAVHIGGPTTAEPHSEPM